MKQELYTPMEHGFAQVLAHVEKENPRMAMDAVAAEDVRAVLALRRVTEAGFLALLSPAAADFLEPMARRAQDETVRNFGRSMQFFTPLYLANFCTNRCVYCGFNTKRDIPRHMLSMDEVEREARCIAATGLRHILALTGDAPAKTGAAYLADCVRILARHFPSVGIEVPSMSIEEYSLVVEAGVGSMTMFQETYNRELYLELHPSGPKRDFYYRLDAPERAVLGGVRSVNLGALLGLDDWRRDFFLTGLHLHYLQDRYPDLEVSVSLPRMRPCGEKPESAAEMAFQPLAVTDADLVQALTALRCFMPQSGITLSTRESAELRDKLIPLGVTRISAGVSTAVGGHAVQKEGVDTVPQFDISDPRSVDEMVAAVETLGYQPVFTDWLFAGSAGSFTMPSTFAGAGDMQL